MKKHRRFLLYLVASLLFWALALPVLADQAAVQFALTSVTGRPGERVNVSLTVIGETDINSVALYNLSFDSAILTFEGFDHYNDIEAECLFPGGFDEDKQVITLALKNSTKLTGFICDLQFTVTDTAKDGTTEIGFTSLVKKDSVVIESDVTSCTVTVNRKTEVHTHELEYFGEQSATCHSAGNREHWKCSSCGRYFSNADGISELTSVTLPVDGSEHDGGTILRDAKDPTDRHDGYTGDTYCLGCGAKLKTGKSIPAYAGQENDAFEDTDPNGESLEQSEIVSGSGHWNNPFNDVKMSDRYYDAVRFVYEYGLFKGVSDTEFAPETTMTRAMFVTVLGRMAEVDEHSFYTAEFTDVVPGQWYAPYVEWAAECGIVQGYGNGKFGVNDRITVEQVVVILARYAESIGIVAKSDVSLSDYRDSGEISDWAVMQMKWAVVNNLYKGTRDLLNPKDYASRSLLAEMMYVFVNLLIE